MLHDREAYQFGGYNNRGQFGGYLLLYSDLPSFARRLFIVISFFVTQKNIINIILAKVGGSEYRSQYPPNCPRIF